MRIAEFPHRRDFAIFNYDVPPVKPVQIEQLFTRKFTKDAHNLILVGGTGTGKTHVAVALCAALINQSQKIRFYNPVDLVNALIKEQAEVYSGKIIT